MAKNLQKRINIRVDDTTFQLLESLATKRGESISSVARRIFNHYITLSNNLQSEVVLDAQDILVATVRKVVRQELKQTEKFDI